MKKPKPVTLVGVVFGVIDMANGEEAILVVETKAKNQYEIPTSHEVAESLKHSRGQQFTIELIPVTPEDDNDD